MRWFLWTMMILYGLSIIADLIHLGKGKYPRIVTKTPLEDGISLMVNIVLGACFYILIFGGN